MQAADFFAMLPMPGAQAQGQGRGLDVAAGMGGLFGSEESGFGLEAGNLENAGFAEALLAVLAVAQPQQAQTPAPQGEAGGQARADARGGGFVPAPPLPADVPGGAVDLATLTPALSAAPDSLKAPPPAIPPALSAVAAPQGATSAPGPLQPDDFTFNSPKADAAVSSAAGKAAAGPFANTAAAARAPAVQAPAAITLPNGLTITPLPDQPPAVSAQAPAQVPAGTPAPDQRPAAAAVPAQVQSAAAKAPAAPLPQPGAAKPEPAPPASQSKVPVGSPAVASVAQPEDTLTDTAVAAASPVEADDAPVADKPGPALPPVPAHAEARGLAHAPAFFDAPKATPQTVAALSAQISKSLEGGKSTRFEIELEPAGLGKVEVRVQIRPSGDIKADLSFESPVAAAELRARSGELQAALERAGFDAAKTQLSFNSGNQQGFGGQFADGFWRDQHQQQQNQSWRGAAFMDLADAPQNPVAAYHARERDGGVDVRI